MRQAHGAYDGGPGRGCGRPQREGNAHRPSGLFNLRYWLLRGVLALWRMAPGAADPDPAGFELATAAAVALLGREGRRTPPPPARLAWARAASAWSFSELPVKQFTMPEEPSMPDRPSGLLQGLLPREKPQEGPGQTKRAEAVSLCSRKLVAAACQPSSQSLRNLGSTDG